MNRIARIVLLNTLAILLTGSLVQAQNLTGIWRGYFISEDGEQYKLEFQVHQSKTLAVTGVSYSYLDVRFYGKATMTGSFTKSQGKMRIREIKTVEVKSTTGGGTCIMNYDLTYSKSGREEFLEGTYLGKQEIRSGENPYKWGDCGRGVVYLRRVTTSNFYVEPFLRRDNITRRPSQNNNSAKETPKRDAPVRRPPVTRNKQTETRKQTVQEKPVIDSSIKKPQPQKEVEKPKVTNVPLVLKERQNELMKSLVVHSPEVTVKLYDNGTIDDDTISVYMNGRLVLSKQRLTAAPLTIKLKLDEENSEHELVMVAENLGKIPPNTSLMIVESGDQRFDVRITSTEQKNALVRFRYVPN